MDIREQILNITKAGAYDAIAPHLKEVKEQNDNFRKAIKAIQDEIVNIEPKEVIANPAGIISRISKITCDVIANNRPL